MAQNTLDSWQWFIKEEYHAIAEIRYKIKQLESNLHQFLNIEEEPVGFSAEVHALCGTLARKYFDYLKIIGGVEDPLQFEEIGLPEPGSAMDWQHDYFLIIRLRQQLWTTTNQREKFKIIKEIVALYGHFNTVTQSPNQIQSIRNEYSEILRKIFKKDNLQLWLISIVDFWNEINAQEIEWSSVFDEWNIQQLQSAQNFFSTPKLVHLVNSLFFYKLYPERLFKELIHPEQLVSVRTQISLLHHCIELLEGQLYKVVLQQGLKPEEDYLFHGEELPHGALMEVDEECRELIQLAIKEVKIKYTHENEEQATLERLHDLSRAYKFWFNPNRLIDAAMVLKQRLVKNDIIEENKLSIFFQKMILLYGQLTTTECLGLYGYFTNKDSLYLLSTLIAIDNEEPFEWLPPLNPLEKNAITKVLQVLQCVMEALRDELKNRHVATESYGYEQIRQCIYTDRLNREAVFRIIAVYGSEAS